MRAYLLWQDWQQISPCSSRQTVEVPSLRLTEQMLQVKQAEWYLAPSIFKMLPSRVSPHRTQLPSIFCRKYNLIIFYSAETRDHLVVSLTEDPVILPTVVNTINNCLAHSAGLLQFLEIKLQSADLRGHYCQCLPCNPPHKETSPSVRSIGQWEDCDTQYTKHS